MTPFRRQPNSDHCFVCGRRNPRGLYMTFYDNGRDEVLSEFAVPEEYQGYPGIVHGGVVAAMLDEVVGRVAMIADHHHFMMSVRLEVKYRHPVPTGEPLCVVGRALRLRGRLGRAEGEIVLADGRIAAQSSMTLADLPAELLAGADLAALGWRLDAAASPNDLLRLKAAQLE
ncbi:MAG: PaaI family thioesterase [Candidatus Promineifilaceae bacterium]